MEHTYAEALWRMVEKGMKPKEAVAALQKILSASGRESLMPRIARAFLRIAEREARRRAVVLSIAHEKDKHAAHKEVHEVLSELGMKADDLNISIDETLIGGWRLEGRERLVDASFKKYLLDMYNRATRS